MNRLPLQSADPQADDSLDRLLRDYYRSKMPRHFPPLAIPTAEPSSRLAAPHASPLSRSRWVLAVCVALVVLAFSLLLNSTITHPNPAGWQQESTATNNDPMKAPVTKTK